MTIFEQPVPLDGIEKSLLNRFWIVNSALKGIWKTSWPRKVTVFDRYAAFFGERSLSFIVGAVLFRQKVTVFDRWGWSSSAKGDYF